MNKPQDSNHDDLLQRATHTLRQTPVTDGPTDDAIAQLIENLDNAANELQSPHTYLEKFLAMKTLPKMTAAAASVLILAGVAMWLITTGGGATVALADVASVLDKIRSATFTGTTTMGSEPPITGKNMYLEPGRCRSESSRGMVMIFGKSKMITLVPEKKIAVLIDLENAPKDGLVKNWLEDVRQKIREAISGSEDDVEELGQRQVDGRDAVGFRLRVERAEMTVWADPVTALPIRVESTSGIMDPKYQHVLTDFRFNVNLDESLFSVEPPEGYSVQEAIMDASAPNERDLIELLRTYCVEQENGLFPATLAMVEVMQGVTRRIQKTIDDRFGDWRNDDELRKEVLQSNEYDEFMAQSMKLGRGIGFLQEMTSDIDWHYAGENVKLGTPARPIFWYRPAGRENYRVIYADLSVKEITDNEVKGFPKSSGPE